MKVCYIYKTTYPGVISEFNLIPIYLAKKKMNVAVIALGGKKFNIIVDKLSYNLAVYRCNLGNNNSTFKFILKSIKFINKKNFDIVHVFHFRWVFLLPLLCLEKNTKWLLDIRSGNLKNDFRRPIANFISKLESKLFDRVDVIHEEVGRKILGKNQGKLDKYHIFPVGIDLSYFKKEIKKTEKDKLQFALNNYVICYFGHLYTQRKLHNLIKTIYISKKNIPNIKLLFIGDGEDKKRLEEVAKRLDLANDIIFTGSIKYEEISDYLGSSDVAISYVPITKGYDLQPPFKTIEYLANEMPVIATNTRGNRFFIKDGENGLLVEDDPESLAAAIVRIAKNPELQKKLIKNSRKSVEKYDWQNIIEENILPVYRNLKKDK